MEKTGILKKIDKMGRISIPKELRWQYQMEYGGMVEIFIDQETICINKHDTETNAMEQVEELYETVERMEQELNDTKQLEYLKQVRNKLEEGIK